MFDVLNLTRGLTSSLSKEASAYTFTVSLPIGSNKAEASLLTPGSILVIVFNVLGPILLMNSSVIATGVILLNLTCLLFTTSSLTQSTNLSLTTASLTAMW